MATMTVKELRAKLEGVDDSLVLTFQANTSQYYQDDEISEEEKKKEEEEPSYTVATGTVYNVFIRDNELVLDGKVNWMEN